MNPERQQAIDYLRAPAKGLWRWAENGAVIVWHDGTTIAFREEVVQVLECLAPRGLPSFGAIVFLLAACRRKIPAVENIVTAPSVTVPPVIGKDAMLLMSARKQLNSQVSAALLQLAKVSQFPSELISGVKAKCILAEAVFELGKGEPYVDSANVLQGLREPLNDADLCDSEHAIVSGTYIRQLHTIAEGLKPHTPDSLALRLRTGLDALPAAADVDLPTAERARKLIEELSRDKEYGAMARAARELMAAVRLPRRLSIRDELAMGGVADITNRGPLDRLLLSELAHDDLTLSVRVALNEALYLRREPPMREPPGTLNILLDSGVRLWGMPRVLATSVALALIACGEQNQAVMTWRANGNQLEPVDLLSRNGLAKHLAILEPTAHVGAALPAFVEAASAEARNQSILITHVDALADHDFRRLLGENSSGIGFVATVDREGRFALHAIPLAHRPPVCEADLDLATVFNERSASSLIDKEFDPDLPAIFSASTFPFLLPVAGKIDFWIKGTDGFVYAVLNDRRLVRFRDQQKGVTVLASDLPSGTTIWMDCDGSEVLAVKAGSKNRPARLLSFSLQDCKLRMIELSGGMHIQAISRYGDVILSVRLQDVFVYALSDGRLLGHATSPHPWRHGRYFIGADHFYFAVWDGERIKFEPVSMPTNYYVADVVKIFDRSGREGPWLLYRNGDIVSTASGEIVKVSKPAETQLSFGQAQLSSDGHQLSLPSTKKDTRGRSLQFLFDFEDKPDGRFVSELGSFKNKRPAMPVWNIYRTVEGIAFMGGEVFFCGRKNQWRKLYLDENGKIRIVLLPQYSVSPQAMFTQKPFKTRYGCMLQVADLASGKIFLDSRGLLHFKSSDPALPEVALVLADGEVAGWTSDGYVCGPPFFFDGPYTSSPKEVFERVMNFFNQ